jgi:hypothetical protein
MISTAAQKSICAAAAAILSGVYVFRLTSEDVHISVTAGLWTCNYVCRTFRLMKIILSTIHDYSTKLLTIVVKNCIDGKRKVISTAYMKSDASITASLYASIGTTSNGN